MRNPEPRGPEPGGGIARAVAAIACVGGGMLLIALMAAMDRWMLG